MQKSKFNPIVPRRNMQPEWTPAELAISNAVAAVEKAGCHPFLTDAVVLLAQAQSKVADFVELPNNTTNIGMTYEQFRERWIAAGFTFECSSRLSSALVKAANGDHTEFDKIEQILAKHDNI